MATGRNILLLALHNFFTDFVFFAPVAIIYFSKVTGSLALGMSIFSVAYGSSALLELPTGVLSDYVGRKRTIVLGSLCSVLAVTFYAIGGSYIMLIIGAILQGASRSFYSGNNDALLHDTLSETGRQHEYHSFLGKTSAMFQVALAIASLTGSVIASWSFALVMWLSVVPQLCALAVALLIKEPKKQSGQSANVYEHIGDAFSRFATNYKLRALSLASVLRFALGESGFFLRSAFVNTIWPLWAVGISTTLSHTGAAASFYFSGRIMKKISPLKVLKLEVLINRIINLIALIFPTVLSPALMGSTSLLFGVGAVSMNTLLQKEFTESQRATMGSINSFAGNVVFAAVSVALGYLGDRFGPANSLIVTHLLLLLPLALYLQVFRENRKGTMVSFAPKEKPL